MNTRIRLLTANDVALIHGLLKVFGEVFDEPDTYLNHQPEEDYLRRLLGGDSLIAPAALQGSQVIGGLVAYELRKFEQQCSEIYIYDLTVLSQHRRKGVATALIERLKTVAAQRGAYVIFVQADTGPEDEAAIALHSKLGRREDVLHFDIAVERSEDAD